MRERIVVDRHLRDAEARERSRLYNTSTLLTLTAGVVICYVALYLLNLAWALFVLDPRGMGGYRKQSYSYGDVFVMAWFVASAATVGGGEYPRSAFSSGDEPAAVWRELGD